MMFSLKTLLVSVVAAAAVSAQEAIRFGSVNIEPSTLTNGSSFTVTYNSTLARYKPLSVDFLIQGTRANGDPTAYISLSRHDYGANQTILQSNETTPDIAGALGDDIHGVYLWAFITYPYGTSSGSSVKLIGGTSAVAALE
ncbi:hypothetical protein CYLTODRAFT_380528 [Cylindrobasidium torrendii FP15055 ss-10]|uniref:CHRD domain-containing protein n=1 Tax=Cylindrobasidium torrendii FP15055 ss-10 TaxID=1314674 RepID=A0A0D7B3H9_9AGAR|nr:hypothetical protein CYLTODRAFT_380528 [Cylindrobasidium torrendii FP15055 ss-10]